MAFNTKITRCRFTLSPFSSEQMLQVGNALNNSMLKRTRSGINANDDRAKPLKPGRQGRHGQERGYPDYKIARGLQPIRDWTWSGRLLRSQKVLKVNENRGVIGYSEDRGDRVAHALNSIDKMFGVSPNDRAVLNQAVSDILTGRAGVGGKVIQFKRAA
jgi:hypothetical protein